MTRRLGLVVAFVALATSVLFAGAVLLCPLQTRISVDGLAPAGIPAGVLFWIGISLAGSSLAVRMSGGSLLDVSFAPLVAALSLGGPAAAAWVGIFGSTQVREVRGQVPWYGVIANHCVITVPAILAAVILQSIPFRSNPAVDFTATVLAAFVLFSLDTLLSAVFTSLRTGERLWSPLRSDAGAYVNLIALAPMAWLMAQIYIVAGWWAVLLFAVPLYTTRLAYSRFVEVREMFTETVRSLAEAVDKRDTFTSGHSHRVQSIAMDIGRVMKVSDSDLEALEWGGLLHDIGKIGVPDSVLLKQERLTREERALMNAHPALGAEIIAPVTHLAAELPIIRHHHEWFNGSGYPDRMVGDEIPLLARILHVADAFEAMTAARPYRMTPLTIEQALAELRKFGGVQFDPDVVDAFFKTKWSRVSPDSEDDEVRDVPLIGHKAGALTGPGRNPGAA
jgi:hypothetical protein